MLTVSVASPNSCLAKNSANVRADYGASLVDNEVGPAVFGDWFYQALEKGVLKCKPDAKIVGHGLESIQAGLEQMEKGASAAKYVVELV